MDSNVVINLLGHFIIVSEISIKKYNIRNL